MIKSTLALKNEDQVVTIKQDAEISAVFIGRQNNSVKSKITFVHTKPNITSRINIKAVLFDNAKFDLEALLKIDKGAENTDAYLKIECLVIGENAFASAIPSLEIKEDSVKAGHGATIGYLDEQSIHYLKSRGLNSQVAEELLIKAFLQ
jgi:Fe-S cluster assembly protein SufD